MKTKTIGVFANVNKPKAIRLVKELVLWSLRQPIELILEEKLAQLINRPNLAFSQKNFVKRAEVIVVLGGDGTLLFAARAGYLQNAPALGVNLGRLGFLASVSPSELYHYLNQIVRNNYLSETRMMLEVSLSQPGSGKTETKAYFALNDVVIRAEALARLIQLSIYVDGNLITEYDADGLIIATPTGSTAHSLSAGGPIVHPSLRAIIITPICPHTLSNRPLIINDGAHIEVKLKTQAQNIFLTVDGQEGIQLNPKAIIRIKKAKQSIKLVYFPNKDYYSILRSKLNWGS